MSPLCAAFSRHADQPNRLDCEPIPRWSLSFGRLSSSCNAKQKSPLFNNAAQFATVTQADHPLIIKNSHPVSNIWSSKASTGAHIRIAIV
jgi:hypothetical protein